MKRRIAQQSIVQYDRVQSAVQYGVGEVQCAPLDKYHSLSFAKDGTYRFAWWVQKPLTRDIFPPQSKLSTVSNSDCLGKISRLGHEDDCLDCKLVSYCGGGNSVLSFILRENSCM